MNEDSEITFRWSDARTDEVLREETRTLKGWTGLTGDALKDWSILHLERVMAQILDDWTAAQQRSSWGLADASEEG